MERRYKSSLRFDRPGNNLGHFLEIELTFEHPVTEQDYESFVSAYQHIISQRAGRQIPRGEISVGLKIGELRESTAYFTASLGNPLWIGLEGIHKSAPYVLPKFIEELDDYQRERKLRYMDKKLVQHVINGLLKIVNDGKKPKKHANGFLGLFFKN